MPAIVPTITKQSEMFEGVKVIIWALTEGRRQEIRAAVRPHIKKLRMLSNEQATLVESGDIRNDRVFEIDEEIEDVVSQDIHPVYIKLGVKQIEGLVVGDQPLGVDDAKQWPLALYQEVIEMVKAELETTEKERKNSESPTTSVGQEVATPKPSTAKSAESADTGMVETAGSTSQIQ